ncbi:DUF4268 domain-containing protein [Haladaptatus sp. SPP-AMP-3]|uniref:DUF4268 domain-containing protein n=1 Tax=Haladaptatus sp. SPP-AMP-3 TaxID=3121295 RepID=UPI003C2F9D9E
MKSEQESIENKLEADLIWVKPRETHSGNMRSNIRVVCEGDLQDRDRWEEYLDWMLAYGERFHAVFPHRLRDLDYNRS